MSKRQVNKVHRDRIEVWRKDAESLSYEAVSYTHLTLPTILLV